MSAIFFVSVSQGSPSDTDEGYFALAGALVASGRHPYRDFFYPQAPLLPFLWSIVHRFARVGAQVGAQVGLSGLVGFPAERAIAGLCAAIVPTLVARAIRRHSESAIAAGLGALLVGAHELGWQWMPAVKAYGPAMALGVGAIVLLTGSRPPGVLVSAASGVLATAAVGCRLLMAPLLLVVPLAIVMHPGWATVRPRDRMRWRAAAAASLAAALMALAIFLAWARPCWEAFVFDNLGYHARRSSGGLFGPWNAKKAMFLWITGLGPGDGRAGEQFLALWVAALFMLGPSRRRRRDGATVWVLAAISLFAANLTPNPVHQQYFTTVIPFLAVPAALALFRVARAIASWSRSVSSRSVEARAALAVFRQTPYAVAAVCYLIWFAPAWQAKFVRGQYGPWNMNAFRPTQVQTMADRVALASRSHPGPVLAFWPGSVLMVPTAIMHGFENQFGRQVATRLSPNERTRFKIASTEDALAKIAARIPALVVIDREAPRAKLLPALGAAGYRSVAEVPPSGSIFAHPSINAPNMLPSPLKVLSK